MTITLFIIGWVLIFFFVIAILLIAFYSSRIDQCRTYATLYCYAREEDGWRCTNIGGATPFTTLASTLADVADKTQLVPCPSTDDVKGTGTAGTVYASYVLAPSTTGTCDTNISDALLPDGCKSTLTLADLKAVPGDPYLVPAGGIVTAQSVFNWYCNPLLPHALDNSAKRAAWLAFIRANPDFQKSQQIVFTGNTGP
jgi:hypothetical protein